MNVVAFLVIKQSTKYMDGEKLIMTIAQNKEANKEEARKAFDLFCGYYQEHVI